MYWVHLFSVFSYPTTYVAQEGPEVPLGQPMRKLKHRNIK